MRRIDIDEPVQPTVASLGQTLLRMLVGVIVLAHGAEKLLHPQAFQDTLIQLSVPNPESVAMAVVGIELLVGFCVIVGRFTRTSSLAVLCDAAATMALLAVPQRIMQLSPALESAALLATAALYFLMAGGGRFSADTLLRDRARIKALRDDEIWQRPPYVAASSSDSYDERVTVVRSY